MGFSVGIISSDFLPDADPKERNSYGNEQIIKEAEKAFDKVFAIDPSATYVDIDGREARVIHWYRDSKGIERHLDLGGELDGLIVKRTRNFGDQIYDLITVLAGNKKLAIYDPPDSYHRPLTKVTSKMLRFPEIRQPRSTILNSANLPTNFVLKYPVFAKPTHGYRGLDSRVCNSRKELEEYISAGKYSDFGYGALLEEKLDTTEEFRVIVIGGKAFDVSVGKINDGKDVNNKYQGGEFFSRNHDLVLRTAESAAEAQGLSFAGVDIVYQGGKCFVLECNRNPDFEEFDKATGLDTASHFIDYVKNDLSKKRNELMNPPPPDPAPLDRVIGGQINSTALSAGNDGNPLVQVVVKGGNAEANSNASSNAHNETKVKIEGALDRIREDIPKLESGELQTLGDLLNDNPETSDANGIPEPVANWIGKIVGKAASGLYETGATKVSEILMKAIGAIY